MRAYIETYGCTLNKTDSKIIEGILIEKGIELVEKSEADYLFINTCAVKLPTERRMVHRIKELSHYAGKLIVCGCLPKINPKTIPENCIVIDTNSLHIIPEILSSNNGKKFFSDEHINKLKLPINKQGLISAIPIGEGCLGRCSFCGTKNARGNLTSYPIKDIKIAVEMALKNGSKEIHLTSQDNGVYGFDSNKNLADLLDELTKICGDFKIRVGMMNPSATRRSLSRLLDAFDNEKIYKFLHLPIQSGSNKVLQDMKRGHNVEDFIEIVDAFKERFPELCLSTDIIVGFPTEEEKDFKETMQLLVDIKPDITNISKFYPRPNTEAARMKKLPTKLIKKRSVEASKLCRELSLKKNKVYIGKTYSVIPLENGKKGNFIARAPNYKQIVLKGVELGKHYNVRIVNASYNYIEGEVLYNS